MKSIFNPIIIVKRFTQRLNHVDAMLHFCSDIKKRKNRGVGKISYLLASPKSLAEFLDPNDWIIIHWIVMSVKQTVG